MELKDIVSVSGMPGLYKIAGQRKNGLIIEALDGSGKKIPTSPNNKISILSDIAMFTLDGEERLAHILLRLKDSNINPPDKKADDAAFRKFMDEAVPNYDSERVYVSDIKKLASWYAILKDQFDFEALRTALKEEENSEEKAEEGKAEEKPKKTAKTKTEKPVAKTAVKGDSKSKGKAVGQVRKMA